MGVGIMFIKGEDVVVSGQKFSYRFFMYLLSSFKEAFSHTSLTIEEAFQDLENFDMIINTSMDTTAFNYYNLLGHREKKEISDLLHQMIVFKGSRWGVFSEAYSGDQRQTDYLYKKHFAFFEPYIRYFIVFDKEGKIDKSATYQKLDTLFINLPQRRIAYEKAYNTQRDNLNAFDYAVSKRELSIADVIQINNIVNESDPDRVLGYKRTNNEVIGASFHTVDKENVPFEMQKLFAEYKDDFGMVALNPNEPGLSGKEKYRRVCDICRKEAEFHIRFIHIHPFNDGNGRTGRIILNQHLLSQGLAPVMISGAMSDEYRRCINESDIEGLAKLFVYSSSLQIANWVSMKKAHPNLNARETADNSELATLIEFEDADKDSKKNKSFHLGSVLF